MEKIVIIATQREVTGKQVRVLRREGKLPAVIYGRGLDGLAITLDEREASRILASATSSSLITINLDGKEYPTLVRDKQKNYLRGSLLHVDFQAVSLTEKIRANVAIEIEGEAPATKDGGALLTIALNELEVECLPTELPERFTVDVSSLNEVGDALYVKDIVSSSKIEILNDPEDMIVVASAVTIEEIVEETEELDEDEDMEPEVIERGKKDEEDEE